MIVDRHRTGEVDIIEFVNDAESNLVSLHTLPGCSIAGAEETGTLLSSDCGVSLRLIPFGKEHSFINERRSLVVGSLAAPWRQPQPPTRVQPSMPMAEACMLWSGPQLRFAYGSSHVMPSHSLSLLVFQTSAPSVLLLRTSREAAISTLTSTIII